MILWVQTVSCLLCGGYLRCLRFGFIGEVGLRQWVLTELMEWTQIQVEGWPPSIYTSSAYLAGSSVSGSRPSSGR